MCSLLSGVLLFFHDGLNMPFTPVLIDESQPLTMLNAVFPPI